MAGLAVTSMVVAVMGFSAMIDPMEDTLVALAKTASQSQDSAATIIDGLRANGAAEQGVVSHLQILFLNAQTHENADTRTRLASNFGDVVARTAKRPPSHAQACALLRLMIGREDAEPDGECVIDDSSSLAESLASSPVGG